MQCVSAAVKVCCLLLLLLLLLLCASRARRLLLRSGRRRRHRYLHRCYSLYRRCGHGDYATPAPWAVSIDCCPSLRRDG